MWRSGLISCCMAVVHAQPNNMFNYTDYASKLVRDKMEWYEKHIPPKSYRPNSNSSGGSLAGTDVKLQIRFYTVDKVDVAHGHMSVKIWLRLEWTDLRLAWNPEDYGGITYTFYTASGLNDQENTNIWVPGASLQLTVPTAWQLHSSAHHC